MNENVCVLGATEKQDRYAYHAMQELRAAGHTVYLVNPRLTEIDGLPCYADLASIPVSIDTVTLYIEERRLPDQLAALIELRPTRVIFNPGTEHAESMKLLEEAGIQVVTACTLVMLRTNQFANEG